MILKVRDTICIILIIALHLLLFDNAYTQNFKTKKPVSPSKMCKKINHNRNKPFKKKISIKKKENDVSRITYNPNQTHLKRTSSDPGPYVKYDVIEDKEPTIITSYKTNLPTPLNDKQAEIRSEVKKKIENGEANEPFIESLYFVTDEDEFAYMDFEPFLRAVEYALQGKMVLVEGHTDNRASEKHNLALSMKRVRQIERLMLDIGVPEDRISVIGYGESMPKYDNNTEEGRQKNRRVDFKIF